MKIFKKSFLPLLAALLVVQFQNCAPQSAATRSSTNASTSSSGSPTGEGTTPTVVPSQTRLLDLNYKSRVMAISPLKFESQQIHDNMTALFVFQNGKLIGKGVDYYDVLPRIVEPELLLGHKLCALFLTSYNGTAVNLKAGVSASLHDAQIETGEAGQRVTLFMNPQSLPITDILCWNGAVSDQSVQTVSDFNDAFKGVLVIQ